MSTKDNNQIKFIIYAMHLMVAVVTYIVFVATDNNPLAGVLFVAPCFMEFLEDLTLNRDDIKSEKNMLIYNWITFGVLIISLVLFTLTAIGILSNAAALVAAIILVTAPAKYAFYMALYYKKMK